MSDQFHGLDATEKAGFEAALNRCRPLAAQIASELRNKRPEHFVDKLALADLCAFLDYGAPRGALRRINQTPHFVKDRRLTAFNHKSQSRLCRSWSSTCLRIKVGYAALSRRA